MTRPTSNPQPPQSAAPPDVQAASVGDLMSRVSRDLSALTRQELALAKAEVKQEASEAGKGASLLAAAGLAGYMVLLFLSIALWWALAEVMDEGLGALVVAVLWGLAAAVLAVLGRRQLRRVRPTPQRTVETVKEVPDALRVR